MLRISIMITAICLTIGASQVSAQATKQLEKRTKDAKEAERKSWEQVDQINNQTDQTNARLNQSRQNANRSIKPTGSTVTTSKVGVASPYRKSTHKKPASAAKTPQHKPGEPMRK